MSASELARKMADMLAAMEPGASETIARVAHDAGGPGYHDDEGSFFGLENSVVALLDERGILLDRTAYWNMDVGLPWNIPFEVRPIVNGSRGPIGIDEVERLLFSFDGFHSGHVWMLLERDERGSLTKTIRGFMGSADFDELFGEPASDRDTEALQEALLRCGVESWHRKYPCGTPEESVLDGDTWEMTICLSNGTRVACFGNNDYPEGFGDLASDFAELGLPSYWS